MNTTLIGRHAEDQTSAYLQQRGYRVLQQNWRTRYCEVDIIASHSQTICFIEVKYRQTGKYGDGLEYITLSKLRQMQFAAELWVVQHNWTGDYQLAVVAVSGPNFNQFDLRLV